MPSRHIFTAPFMFLDGEQGMIFLNLFQVVSVTCVTEDPIIIRTSDRNQLTLNGNVARDVLAHVSEFSMTPEYLASSAVQTEAPQSEE